MKQQKAVSDSRSNSDDGSYTANGENVGEERDEARARWMEMTGSRKR